MMSYARQRKSVPLRGRSAACPPTSDQRVLREQHSSYAIRRRLLLDMSELQQQRA